MNKIQTLFFKGEEEKLKKELQDKKDSELKQGMLENISLRKKELYDYKFFKIVIDLKEFSDGVKIKQSESLNYLKDARNCSKLAEFWASKLYGLKLSENSNDVIDATIEIEDYKIYSIPDCIYNPKDSLLANITIGIKTLKDGIKLQQSQQVGRGLGWDPCYLTETISLMDLHIAVDLKDVPEIYFLPFRSADILSRIVEYVSNTKKKIPESISRNLFFKLAFGCKSREDLKFIEINYKDLPEFSHKNYK